MRNNESQVDQGRRSANWTGREEDTETTGGLKPMNYLEIDYLPVGALKPYPRNARTGIDKLTRIGRKWSSIGHCYPDAVAASQVASALALR